MAEAEDAGGQRFYPLIELTLARLRGLLREPGMIFWIFVFPVILAFVLGIAFRNQGPEKIPVAVESSNSNMAEATALVNALGRSGEIDAMTLSHAEAAQALRSGKVALVVRLTDEAAKLRASRGEVERSGASEPAVMPRSFDYRYDPTRPDSRQARLAVDNALQRALGRTDVVQAGDEKIVEPGARYIDFLIPGLLGMNLMGTGLWGVGFAVVIARTQQQLKRLAATPMRRSHYLLSFVISRLIFLVFEVTVVIASAWIVFGFTVRGSFVEIAFLLLVGAMTFTGIGLLVASRARTIEGVSGLMNLVMVPMWLLSGTFFSSARFPDFLQPFIKILPLTALNDSLRAVMNDGAALTSRWAAICILLAWCAISFIIALRIFRWQ